MGELNGTFLGNDLKKEVKSSLSGTPFGNDKGLEYDACLKETVAILDDLKKAGFDVQDYEQKLMLIDRNCKEDARLSSQSATASMLLIHGYTTSKTQVESIKCLLLNTFDIYFKIKNSCDVLDARLKQNSYSDQDITSFTEEALHIMNALRMSNTILYHGNEEALAQRVYQLVYQVMIGELLAFGESRILSLSNLNDEHRSYLNAIVREKIQTISSDNFSCKKIKEKMALLDSTGLEATYLDADLLLDVAIALDGDLKDSIKESFKGVKNRAECLSSEYEAFKPLFISCLEVTKDESSKVKVSRKKVVHRVLAFVGTLAITSGAFFVSKVPIQDQSTKREYYTVEESIVKGEKQEALTSYERRYQYDQDIKVIDYSPWIEDNFGYERIVTTYNLGDLTYESIEDYYNLDMQAIGIEGVAVTQKKDELCPSDRYTEAYRDVHRLTQDEAMVQESFSQTKYDFWNLVRNIAFLVAFNAEALLFGRSISKKLKESIVAGSVKRRGLEHFQYKLDTLQKLLNDNDELHRHFNAYLRKYRAVIRESEIRSLEMKLSETDEYGKNLRLREKR